MEWIIGYFIVGAILTIILWKIFNIDWKSEDLNVKITMIIIPWAWPGVLAFIGVVGIMEKFRGK